MIFIKLKVLPPYLLLLKNHGPLDSLTYLISCLLFDDEGIGYMMINRAGRDLNSVRMLIIPYM